MNRETEIHLRRMGPFNGLSTVSVSWLFFLKWTVNGPVNGGRQTEETQEDAEINIHL